MATNTAKTVNKTTGKALVIVESPTKQKTISKILGPNFIVRSSFGHVRDLPSKEIGVDEKNNFTPTYVVSGKPRIIADLKESLKTIDYKNSDKETILNAIKEAGIVGLGGAGFPTYVKYSSNAVLNSLLINQLIITN